MTIYKPSDSGYENRVRTSFARQNLMSTIGAKLHKVAPGEIHIQMPFRSELTQQNGYIHAGIITSIVDSACGYAAYTLTPVESEVLSVEFKINFLRPAVGDFFIGTGKVIKQGRKLTVCSGEAFAFDNNREKLIAAMQATIMTI